MEFSKGWLVTALSFVLAVSSIATPGLAQSNGDDPSAIAEKYLDVLIARPRMGTAVARVYTHHLQNDSLDDLFERLQTDGDTEPDGRRRMVLGLIESHRGNYEQAVANLTVATAQLPDNPLAHFYLGQAHAALGKTDAATDSMRAAIDRDPARADALEIFTTLGQLLSRQGRKDDALAVWEQMEEHFPNDRRIGGRIAKALAQDQRFQLARDRYLSLSKLTKLDSERVEFQIEAAEMLRRSGDRDAANGEFETILKRLRPGSWLHQDVVTRIEAGYLASNDYSGLADYYEQRLEKEEDIAMRIRLGRIRILEGNLAKAKTAFENAIELAPNDAEVRLALIDLLQQSFDYGAAAKQLEILAKQDPGNPDYILRWGKMLLEENETPLDFRRKAASKVWLQLADANPDDAVKLALVADQLRSINASKDAVELYRSAIEASPDDPQFREYLGEYLMSLGRTDEAIETWTSIAAPPRRDRQSLVRLAEIYGVFKMPDKAIDTWTEAAEFDLTLDERVRFAVKLRDSEKYPRAFEQLRLAAAVAETDEESERVFLAELDTHIEAGSLRDHIADFASSKPTANNLRKLAVMWRVAAELDEAKRAIDRAEKMSPDDIEILLASVEIADQQGRIGDAAQKLKRLAKLDRRFRPNHLKRLADLQIKLARFDEALKTCRELIAATPASAESYSFFAKVAFEAQKDEQAIDALRQALRIAPRDNLARRRLAQALADRYRTEEAIELYFEAIRFESNHYERVSLVALLTPLYQRQNKLDQLFPRLETFGREIGDPRVASLLIAQAHEASGNLPEARKRLENLLLSQPYDTKLLEEAVRLTVAARELDDAVTFQQRLTEIAATPANEARLIDLKVAAGQLSIQDAFRIQMESVTDASILASIARKVIDRNDHAKAVIICRKLLAQNPAYWDAQFHLARALVLQARSAGQSASSEGMQLLRDLMQQRIPIDTPPPLFASGNAAPVPNEWGKPLGVLMVAGQQQQSPFGRRAPMNFWIELDSLAHAQTLAAAVILNEVHRTAPAMQEMQTFKKAWDTEFPKPPEGEPHETLLLWRQLILCAQADVLKVNAQQSEVRLDIIWRLAELDPLLIANNVLESFPQTERQLKAFENVFKAVHADVCGPGETLHETSFHFRKALVKHHRDRGNGEKADSFLPELSEELSYRDLVLAAQFFADTQETSRFEKTISLMMGALRRSQSLVGKSNQVFDMPIAWTATDESSQPVIRRNELALLDLVFAGARQTQTQRGWRRLGASVTGTQAIRTRIQQFRQVRGSTPNLTLFGVTAAAPRLIVQPAAGQNQDAPLTPLENHLFDTSYTHTANLVAMRARGKLGEDGSLPEDYLQHLEKTDFDGPPLEKVARRAFAAFARWNSGKREQAFSAIEALARDYPEQPILQIELARFAHRLGRFGQALSILETVNPADTDLLITKLLAEVALASKTGRIVRVRSAFDALNQLELTPRIRMSLVAHANSLGMEKQATRLIDQMPRADTLPVEQQIQIAKTIANNGQNELAGEIAYSAFKRLTTNYTVTRRVANQGALDDVLDLLRSLGRLQPLIENAERQVASAPTSIDLQLQLAEYYQLAGRLDEADAIWGEILKRNDFITADRLLARAAHLKDISRNNDAADYYLRMIRESPSRFSQHYSDITRVISRTGRVADLYKVLANTPPSLIPAYRIDDLLRLDGANAFGDRKREFLRNAMSSKSASAILHEVIGAVPEGDPAVAKDLSRVAITAVSRRDAFKPNSSLWQVDSRSTDGIARGPLDAILALARVHEPLQHATRSAISGALENDETAPTAEVVRALLDIRDGDGSELARAAETLYLWSERQRLAQRTSQRLPLSGGLLWQAGQIIAASSVDDASGLAVELFEAAKCDPKVLSGTDPQYGIMHRLVDAYAEDGRPEQSRRILLDAYRRNSRIITHRTVSNRTIYERLRANRWYAEALFDLGYYLDAAMIYRRDTADAAQFEQVRNYGPAIGLTRFVKRLETIVAKIDNQHAADYLSLLTADLQQSTDRQAVILCDVSMRQLTRVDNRSRLLEALQIASTLPDGDAAIDSLREVLEQETAKRPSDWSLPAAQLLVAMVTGTGDANAHYAELTKRLPEKKSHPKAKLDTEFRIALRSMFELYIVADIAVAGKADRSREIGAELSAYLDSIAEHANRPGMGLALSVLGDRSDEVSAVLDGIDKETVGEALNFEQTHRCLDIAKHRIDKNDLALSLHAFRVALRRGPPAPALESVDPFNYGLNVASSEAAERNRRESQTIIARVNELVGLYRLTLKQYELDDESTQALYQALHAVVLPENRSPVLYPYRTASHDAVTWALTDDLGSALSLLIVAARQANQASVLRDELQSRIELDINAEAMFEALIELARRTEDLPLLSESLTGFRSKLDHFLPPLDSDRPAADPAHVVNSFSPRPPDAARKAQTIEQVARTLLPLIGMQLDSESAKTVHSMLGRTANLIASDGYTFQSYRELYERIEGLED